MGVERDTERVPAAPRIGGLMKTTILAAIGLLVAVPGVVNYQSLGTVIACTNTKADTTASVTVEIFDNAGGFVGSATAGAVAEQNTVSFSTRGITAIPTDFTIASPLTLARSSAKIFSTSKSVMCTAYLADAANTPPTSMASLVVVAGKKQK
jgi:hypothetical protein